MIDLGETHYECTVNKKQRLVIVHEQQSTSNKEVNNKAKLVIRFINT